MIKKKCTGYRYENDDNQTWNVTTDYICGNIYLDEPEDDDIESIEEYGKGILRAVKDFRKDTT